MGDVDNVPLTTIRMHLDWCFLRNLRPGTIYQRGRALVRYVTEVGRPLEATKTDVDRWWSLLGSRVLPESRATELSHVRGFYRWAILEGLVDADPTAHLQRPKLPLRLPNPMPQPDVDRALAMAPTRVRPWLYLATFAGLRCSEIAPLRAEHLRFRGDTKVILVPEEKGGGMGAVSAPPVLVRQLEGLPRRGFLFPRQDGKAGHIPGHLVSQMGNRYLHSLGIGHTMHSLRHWYGTETYQASGRDLRQTQQALRHRSVLSTQRYTWVDPGELAEIVGRLPGASYEPESTALS